MSELAKPIERRCNPERRHNGERRQYCKLGEAECELIREVIRNEHDDIRAMHSRTAPCLIAFGTGIAIGMLFITMAVRLGWVS